MVLFGKTTFGSIMANCTKCQLPIETKTNNPDSFCGPCKRVGQKEPRIWLTPIERDDLELVLAWRSNPEIYRYFRQQDGPLRWNEHVDWFESRPTDRADFIIHYGKRRVGVVNINPDDEVGIYLGDVSARGKGVATKALNWLCDRFDDREPLFAEIHKENDASKRLFRHCGFRQEDTDEDWETYIYESLSATSSQ